jgi:hypothetical protein
MMGLRISSSELLNHLSFSTHHVRPRLALSGGASLTSSAGSSIEYFSQLMFALARSGGTPDLLTGRTPLSLSPVAADPGSWAAAANRAHSLPRRSTGPRTTAQTFGMVIGT